MKTIRYIAVIVCAVVLISQSIIYAPTARAIGGDWALFGFEVSKWVTEAANWIWANVLQPVLRDQIVKRIVDSLTDDIINAIENGGSPQFLQSWSAFTGKASDLAFDEFNNFLTKNAGLDLCAPFTPQLTVYFYNNIAGANRYPFGIPARCTFTNFQQNIQNSSTFIQSGGWIGLQQLFLPENNLFGAGIAMESAYYQNIAAEREKRIAEVQMGKGFLSIKQCTGYQNIENLDDVTPVSPSAFQSMAETWCSENNDGSSDCIERLKESNCVREEIKTPGDTVAQAASKAVLKDFEYASNVQSIISALVNVFVRNVFNETKGLLFGSSSRGGSGIGTTYDFAALTGNQLENKWKSVERQLEKIRYNYYRVQIFLEGKKGANGVYVDGIIPNTMTARRLAIQAIYNCYMGVKDSMPLPRFGTAKYWPQKDVPAHSPLGSLVNWPLTLPNKDNTLPELITMVEKVPWIEAVAQRLGRTFPPEQGIIPTQEGFLETTYYDAVEALAQAKENARKLEPLFDRLRTVSTSTDPIVVASSTAALSDILNKANEPYSDFTSKYQKFVLEPLSGDMLGVTPGQLELNGIGNSIVNLIQGLSRWDDIINQDTGDFVRRMIDSGSFYYCTARD